MFNLIMTMIFTVYAITVLILMAYGFHSYFMIILFYLKQKKARNNVNRIVKEFFEQTQEKDLPFITIQLPVYNESEVIKRLMLTATQVDYPKNKFEIQVVDDSSDETVKIVNDYTEELKASTQTDIYVVRRNNREQFKAGALSNALKAAKGEYVVIFDSDFIIPKNFLKRSIAQIHNKYDIACVQARWGHLNRFENWLTKAQSIALDAHFAASQGARNYNGLCMNFNGTAGIWRISAINAVGGWSGDTLTEDMDLSYRVQLHGYKMAFDYDLVCPAELPNNMMAFKSQQKRWAKGAMETGIKLLPSILKSKNLTFHQKFEAFMHLTNNFAAVLIIVLMILTLPVLIAAPHINYEGYLPMLWTIVVLASVAPCALYTGSGAAQKRGFFSFRNFPLMIAVGTGLCINNTLAVLEAILGKKSAFIRTPKSGSSDKVKLYSLTAIASSHASAEPAEAYPPTPRLRHDTLTSLHPRADTPGSSRRRVKKTSHYKVGNNIMMGIFELILGIYCTITFIIYIIHYQYFFGFFIGVYAVGLIIFGISTITYIITGSEILKKKKETVV